MFERLLSVYSERFVEHRGVLPTTQFARRKGMDTSDVLLGVSHTVQSVLERGQEARIIQIDLKSNWEILVTWGHHYMQQHSQLFVCYRASIHGMAYQVTYAAHHRSVLSRISYDSCISLLNSFQIYIVSMIIKLLSSSTCNIANWQYAMLINISGINYYNCLHQI